MVSASDTYDLADLLIGTPYRAVARIAKGGMGEVVEVEHELLGRRFVAKVLHARLAEDPSFVERVRVEAQATARLRHPNIVEVTDYCVTSAGRPCLVMEKLRGCTLRREVAVRGALPLVECLSVLEQLLAALTAAHKLGVVHRDLKPDNLFLHQPVGGGRRLKVLDFGLARVLPIASLGAPTPSSIPTKTGRVVGTPGYVSPEALLGATVDHRADLYGAGVLLFFLLTGRGPFDHLPAEATLSQAPVPPSRFRNEQSMTALDSIVIKALRKRPEERHQSAQDLWGELATVQHQLASTSTR